MRPSRRLLATPIVLTTVLTLAACGDESPDARGSEPIDTTETTETTVPDATPQPLTIGSLGDDDLVFRLGLSGSNGGDDPSLVSVYANGNVIVSSDSKPLGFATFRVGDAALDELLGLATAARPFGDVDYGEPEVTDVGSTVVTVHVDRGSTTVSAWALGFDTGELDPQQTEARRRLDARRRTQHRPRDGRSGAARHATVRRCRARAARTGPDRRGTGRVAPRLGEPVAG